MSASHIWLLTPLTPVRYSILSSPNLLILCDICDMKASQGIRTANNAQHTRETVSQAGYNMLLRQKCLFAIMPYYFDQFLKLQKSPSQELGCIHISMTNPRVSFAKLFEKDRSLPYNVSKCLVLSESTTFYKGKSHILNYMKAFPCTEGDNFKVYKHSQVLFLGRKIHFL